MPGSRAIIIYSVKTSVPSKSVPPKSPLNASIRRQVKQIQNENDPKKLVGLLSSLLTRRELSQRLGGTAFRGQRDYYETLGYTRVPTFADYQAAYDRDDIAARIVDCKPESTWRRRPVISNASDPKTFTEFEQQWSKLEKQRRVLHYLERADKLAGIGEYGMLLLGTDDVRNAEDLAKPMAKLRHGINSVIYLAPFTQRSAEVSQVEDDPSNPRFGLPSVYQVSVTGTNLISGDFTGGGASGLRNERLPIHWSRVIHIAEGLQENDYVGTPRLRPILNRLQDVTKVAGGSAEIFWQAAKRIMILQAKDGFSGVDNDDALTVMMDELIHGLRRVIDVQGYDVKTLEQSEVKPRETFDIIIALIASATGIPQRILLGSEIGKLASDVDETNWNGRIADRQLNFAEPVILRPFIDRLVSARALPDPGGYLVTWPSLFELSDKERAQVALLKSRALRQYLGAAPPKDATLEEVFAQTQEVIPINEFRGEILGMRSPKIETDAAIESTQGGNPDTVQPDSSPAEDETAARTQPSGPPTDEQPAGTGDIA